MILRLILGDKAYRVKSAKDDLAPGLQLLIVNKSVSNEVLAVLRETATCKLDFKAGLRANFKSALRLFRHFEIDVLVHRPYSRWDDKADRLRKFWSHVKEQLLNGHDEHDKQGRIILHFNFRISELQTGWVHPLLDQFHPQQDFLNVGNGKTVALYYKQQLKLFTANAQEDLKVDFVNGRVTTNADVPWPAWLVHRLDEHLILCHNTVTGTYTRLGAVVGGLTVRQYPLSQRPSYAPVDSWRIG